MSDDKYFLAFYEKGEYEDRDIIFIGLFSRYDLAHQRVHAVLTQEITSYGEGGPVFRWGIVAFTLNKNDYMIDSNCLNEYLREEK